MPDKALSAPIDAWPAIRQLVSPDRSLSDLQSHGMHLIAARRWREEGSSVPEELARQELFAIWQVHVAEEILGAISDIVGQDVIVVKGLAVESYYPYRALRPFGDLDVVVADPARAQARLIAAGFRRVPGFAEGFFEGHHHLEPLELPGRETVKVEIHSRVPWVHWCASPSFREVRRMARPGPTSGVWFPDPVDHALILACHSWHSLPLRRALDLVDIAMVTQGVDRAALASVARRRHVSRLWHTTRAASDALLSGSRNPLSMRIWARDLRAGRECSVIERHMRTWFAPFWARAPHRAALEALRAITLDARPTDGESWPEKLDRARRGVRHPLCPIGDHDKDLGAAARRLRPRRGRSSGPSKDAPQRADRSR